MILTEDEAYTFLNDDPLPESGTTEGIIWRCMKRYARDIAIKEALVRLATERALANELAAALEDLKTNRYLWAPPTMVQNQADSALAKYDMVRGQK